MVYTEIKEKNSKKYYYRVKSLRVGIKVMKRRVYLGANLKKHVLLRKEKEADKELMLLSSLLSEKEIKELEEIKKQYLKEPKESLENRYEAFCSLFTYNSTAIEGNTLTLQETSLLLFEKLVPRKSLREINEVLNHKEAFDFILKTKEDVSKKLISKLHEIVIQNTLKPGLEKQIGKYREIQVYIRGVSWIPSKPKDVPKEMKALFLWYSKNRKKLHPLVLAAYFHSSFEMIHPFVDGNGRVGRLLMNFILHKNNYPMVNIPNSKKHLYFQALQEAQNKGNLKPFVEFLIKLLKAEKIRF
ncbi:MAG: Fic family protein [Nanoarchaeota archaeon]